LGGSVALGRSLFSVGALKLDDRSALVDEVELFANAVAFVLEMCPKGIIFWDVEILQGRPGLTSQLDPHLFRAPAIRTDEPPSSQQVVIYTPFQICPFEVR
jgi:hypothetical protein